MTVAPTVIEVTDLEEMLEKSVPCENVQCRSNRQSPAAWLFTHHGGDGCSTLYCSPCRDSLSAWIDNAIRNNHQQKFDCMRCGAKQLAFNDLIFRRL